jgi:OOP family OmpA-OmpF porin
MNYRKIAFLSAFYTSVLGAQNLVPNPSFEDYSQCPLIITQYKLEGLNDWFQPTMGSADYYNSCAKMPCSVPENMLGKHEPRTGKGYVGIICYLNAHKMNDYREYLEVPLKERMIKGHRYCVQLHVSLAQSSEYMTSNIDVLFSRFVVKSEDDKVLKQVPQLRYQGEEPIREEGAWKEISWIYTAEGGERFMVIGNFNNDKHTVHKLVSKQDDYNFPVSLPEAYYYMDDVGVVDQVNQQDSTLCNIDFTLPLQAQDSVVKKEIRQEAFDVNKKFILKNIYFNTDQAMLLPASDMELNKLAGFLKQHPKLKLTITGHTDNQGTAEHNQVLSLARAKAVESYLIDHGIGEERIETQGMGMTQPISSNETEEGRASNRRVEVVFQ